MTIPAPRILVACNVYVSAAGGRHGAFLLRLLHATQQRCQALRAPGRPVAVVHAFADNVYDRSSFHFVGEPGAVADVAGTLAADAVGGLVHNSGSGNTTRNRVVPSASETAAQLTSTDPPRMSGQKRVRGAVGNGKAADTDRAATRHPFVGMVDHVSVMPLAYAPGVHNDAPHAGTGAGATSSVDEDVPRDSAAEVEGRAATDASDDSSDTARCRYTTPDEAAACGTAARAIGAKLADAGVLVYYYGSADPGATPLPEVRRQRTAFFKSGGLDAAGCVDQRSGGGTANAAGGPGVGVATVGAPPGFVENFNIRLTAACDRRAAVGLARRLRGRDGGLVGVEALTLPYTEGTYEVACNLIHPDVSDAERLREATTQWVQGRAGGTAAVETFVAKWYRVGTTAGQCRAVAVLCADERTVAAHDKDVAAGFARYLKDA